MNAKKSATRISPQEYWERRQTAAETLATRHDELHDILGLPRGTAARSQVARDVDVIAESAIVWVVPEARTAFPFLRERMHWTTRYVGGWEGLKKSGVVAYAERVARPRGYGDRYSPVARRCWYVREDDPYSNLYNAPSEGVWPASIRAGFDSLGAHGVLRYRKERGLPPTEGDPHPDWALRVCKHCRKLEREHVELPDGARKCLFDHTQYEPELVVVHHYWRARERERKQGA